MKQNDTIFKNGDVGGGTFRFDERVAAVFDDMIERSVPGYGLTLDLLSVIAGQRLTHDDLCYDLGCSLGASTLAILRGLGDVAARVVAVDNSTQMLAAAELAIERAGLRERVELRCADIRQTPITDASMVVMNFTLQFIPVSERQALLHRISAAINPGGVLVLSEKLCFENAQENTLLCELHHEFKRQRGYSDLEIARKRSALENVLVAESLDTHRERLLEAGFSQVTVWLQCFNFVSILAEK